MSITLEQVREFIRYADKNALETVSDIIQSRWKHLNAELAMTFNRGDRVSWYGTRRQGHLTGTVVSTDGKWVKIDCDAYPKSSSGFNYKASPTLLKKV